MEKPIRVLQVLGRLDRGGAETMIMNLYRHIDREQVQFDFVIHTEDECDYSEEVRRLGGRIFSMKPFRVSTAFSYGLKWRAFFKEHAEYAVIHGHVRSTASIYLAEAKKAGRITIAHSHNTSSGKGISAVVKNVLQYPLRFQADYLFACSQLTGKWLYGEKACKKKNFYVLLNGVEIKKYRFDKMVREKKRRELLKLADASKDSTIPADRRSYEDAESLVLLHVGRLEEQKNHSFLLRIMKEIVLRSGNAYLFCCGVGPLQEALKKEVKEMKLENHVFFLGMREDILQLLQAADGMVFPSKFEGLPVTLVEAQAMGLPVLMSDTITKEVILTDLVSELSLQESAQVWADKALELMKPVSDRTKKYADEIAGKGYDAVRNAKWLEGVYIDLSRNGKSKLLDGENR